jgi:hypothetical protein
MALTKLKWDVINTQAICELQDGPNGGGNLLLNGTFASADIPNQISLIANGVSRSVSITSTGDRSNVQFTVAGFQNGSFLVDTITGPNNTTVYGTQIFDIITNIYVDGTANQVSVGTGGVGYLEAIPIILDTIINISVSVIIPPGSGLTYSLFHTLNEITTSFTPYVTDSSFIPAFGLSNMTTTGYGNLQESTGYVLLKVDASVDPKIDTLEFRLIQQG